MKIGYPVNIRFLCALDQYFIIQDSANKEIQEIFSLVFYQCLYNKQNITRPHVPEVFLARNRDMTDTGNRARKTSDNCRWLHITVDRHLYIFGKTGCAQNKTCASA